MYIKLLMIFIMLFDSVSVFGRANRNKKRKRSRVALSKHITRSKENKNNIKNGGLNFENPGSIFKKIDKDMNQNPPKQNEPQPAQPEPPKDNNITDGNMPPINPLPYVPPYISKFPPKKPKPKEDTDKEVKETIAQLKNQIASAKNTCGAYTQTMTSINKQLGLGVTMTSGIGAGLSAIATTTGAISYGKSKQQDKNFANHKEKQDGIIKMAQNQDSLLNFDGGTSDNDDLTKITATEKTLKDDKILALRKAEEEEKELRGKLAKATEELNNPSTEEYEEKMPDIQIPQYLQKVLTDANNLPTEPKEKTPSKQPKKPVADPEEERVKGLEHEALAMQNAIDEAEKSLAQLTKPQQSQEKSNAYREAEAKANGAAAKYNEDEFVKLEAAAKEADKFLKNPNNNPKNYKSNDNPDYVARCQNAHNFMINIKTSSDPLDREIYSYIIGPYNAKEPTKSEEEKNKRFAIAGYVGIILQAREWQQIKSRLGGGYCCKAGNLRDGSCKLVNFISKKEAERKWNDALEKIKEYQRMLGYKSEMERTQKDFDKIKQKEEAAYTTALETYNKTKEDLEAKCNDEAKRIAAAKKEEAEDARSKFNEDKKQAALAAKTAEEQARQAKIEELKKQKQAALDKANQDIADYIETEKAKWEQAQKKKKEELLEEKRNNVATLTGELQQKQEEIAQKRQVAQEQLEQQELQKQQAADVAQKQKELSSSAETINENHKLSRAFDITTATVSAVSSVASGVSMGFSIATIKQVEKAIEQLKACKGNINQINILNGKYLAITQD